MKTKILQLLEAHHNEYIREESIMKLFHLSNQSVSQHIHTLISEGYSIIISKEKSYCLNCPKDELNKDIISNSLHPFYTDIEVLDSITSTNDYLKEVASNKEEGFVCIANQQVKGKGRNGRSFYSPSNTGIYMSILLKPRLSIYESLKITACASVAIWCAIQRNYQIHAGIKWVNDLLVEEKKIGGILCESSLKVNSDKLDYMVVGIGLNVHKQVFHDDLQTIASSIEAFSNKIVSRNQLIGDILNYFYQYYNELATNSFLPIYKQNSTILHKQITVYDQKQTYIAKVLDINENANLIIKKEDGSTAILNSGEISISGM